VSATQELVSYLTVLALGFIAGWLACRAWYEGRK